MQNYVSIKFNGAMQKSLAVRKVYFSAPLSYLAPGVVECICAYVLSISYRTVCVRAPSDLANCMLDEERQWILCLHHSHPPLHPALEQTAEVLY